MLENEIIIKEDIQKQLEKTAMWTKYAAAISITGTALGLISIIVNVIKGNASSLTQIFGFFIGAVISTIMAINLIKCSNLLKRGIDSQISSDMSQAFYHLKNYFTILGVLFIIIIGIVALVLIIALITIAVK